MVKFDIKGEPLDVLAGWRCWMGETFRQRHALASAQAKAPGV